MKNAMSLRLIRSTLLVAGLSVLGLSVAGLSACGFHLRGQQTLPFNNLAVPGSSALVVDIRRAVSASTETRVQEEAAGADAVLSILREQSEKVILSLSREGRVREYQLRYLVTFRVARPQGGEFLPPSTIILTRDMTFNDQVLPKEGEEAMLYKEMRADFVQQLMRRMAASKPIVIG
ncbi:MAG TPA: LPS assembly lipoprotein LptE [Burkholderiales bacterium]|nr:LPS assembly lipoprotein LptE [Burkholderiales bacterium]